jgi:hypothetical protein
MLLRAFGCVTIVAAFSVGLDAAPPISEEVPVPAEVVAVARSIGLQPPRDRARFLAEFARLLYTPPLGKNAAVAALLNPRSIDPAENAASRAMRVPIPLSADVWSRAIFKRAIPPDRLVAAIMGDRSAALLGHALAALDDETLAFLAQHTTLLMRLYESSASAFAAFGPSLRIRGNRVATPGGPDAAPLWEGVVHERVTDPEAFVRALFQLNDGRVAYVYDTIAQLDAPRAAFAVGAWMTDPVARLARFQALIDICSRSYREWRLETLPFSKPLHDLALLLLRVQVDETGLPASPGSRGFWSAVFDGDDLNPAAITIAADPASAAPIDAAWIADITSGSDMFWRGDRLDQFAFGQRLFAGVGHDAAPAAVVAIRAFPRQRMLLLTLERMGIRSPSVHASIARQAHRMIEGSANQVFRRLAQVQSSVALVARMTKTGTLSREVGERLLTTLFALPLDGDRRDGALAGWLERELLPLMPKVASAVPSEIVEERLMAGLAGPDAGPAARHLTWEGQKYRVDLAHGERQRLKLVRQKQQGYSVDLAMTLDAAARSVAADGLTIDKVREIAGRLAGLPETFGRRLNAPLEARAAGVDQPRPSAEWLEKFDDELARSVRSNDVKRAARLASSIHDIADVVLADALLSLAYTADLGDPESSAMLARNVALRHDFGFGRKDMDVRARSFWAVPRQDFLPGVPWHVTGSVLGLDVAMASLTLRRISPDRIADAPRLPSNEREAFAVGLTSMNARALNDADRDAIVRAIQKGRARIAALAAGAESIESIGDAIGLDGWRRRAIPWMLTHDNAYIPEMFTLAELLMLGGGMTEVSPAGLDAWGTTALQSEGCACTRMRTPRTWRLLSGRPQMAFMASGIPDLNLFLATALAELRLPASLMGSVLAPAILDFVEAVSPTDPNDFWSVARAARAVSHELIEDYIAAAATVDGPLVPDETDSNEP